MRILIFLVTVCLADFASFNVTQDDFENLVKQVAKLETTVEELENQNSDNTKKIAELEAAAVDHEYHIEELQNENENLIERVTRLEVK